MYSSMTLISRQLRLSGPGPRDSRVFSSPRGSRVVPEREVPHA